MDENRAWQKLIAEFLGTAFLVFVGVGSVPALAMARGTEPFTGSELGFISLSFGAVVIGTVYVFGYISGNHINPAVTVALAATGKFPWREVPGYGKKASDLGLGVAAYGDIPVWQAFTAEFIGTFILVFTVFGVIHRKAAPGFAGIVIGFIVFAAIIPVAPVTGASINPARTTGPMLVQSLMGGTVAWEQWPVYVLAQLAAGVAAGLLFGLISRTQADRTTLTEALTEQESRA